MTMKLPIDEMKISEKYWLDDSEEIFGELISIEPNSIVFKVEPQEIYTVSDDGFVRFQKNEYYYKPLN
jgi:hypothetical protein